MAGKNLGALIGQLGADTRQWDKAMSKVQSDLARFQAAGVAASQRIGDAFQRAGRGLENIGRTLTTSVTLPLAAAGGMAVKKAGDFQRLQVQLNALTGSAEAGAEAFEKLVQFSARTPFQLEELTRVNNTLLGFGANAEQAFDWMTMLADAAAISGANMQSLSIAFGQAAAEGRVMTRDIRQFINSGVPAVDLLAESMGVAKSEIFDLAEQGEISFQRLLEAFRMATAEGGRYEDGVEKLAKTIPGLFSTLVDKASIALSQLGEAINDAFNLEEVIPQLGNAIQAAVNLFTDLEEEVQRKIIRIAGYMALSGPAAIAIGKFVGLIGAMVKFVGKALPVMASIFRKTFWIITGVFLIAISAGQQLVNQWQILQDESLSVGEKLSAMWESFTSPMETAGQAVETVVGEIIDATEGAFDDITEKAGDITGANDALEAFYAEWDRLAKENAENVKESSEEAFQALSGINIGRDRGVPSPGLGGSSFGLNEALVGATAGANLEKAEARFNSIREAIQTTTDQAVVLGQTLQSVANNAITSFAETIGNAFTGDAGARGFFKNILLIVVDFAKRFGKLLVAAGLAAEAFQKLLVNPAAAIVAGAALIALATAVRNLLTEGPSQSVDDALITNDGKVIKLNPNDDVLASKNLGETVSNAGGMGGNAQGIERAIQRGMERAVVIARMDPANARRGLNKYDREQSRVGN